MKSIRAGGIKKKKRQAFQSANPDGGIPGLCLALAAGTASIGLCLLYSKYLPLLYVTELEQWTLKPVLKALQYFLFCLEQSFPEHILDAFPPVGWALFHTSIYFIHSCTEKEWKGALQSFNPVSNP